MAIKDITIARKDEQFGFYDGNIGGSALSGNTVKHIGNINPLLM